MISNKQKMFIKKYKRNKLFISIMRISIFISFFIIWEFLSRQNIINSFIFSSPSKIINCIFQLYKNNNLISHILKTLYEVIISFSITSILSLIISIILYEYTTLSKILDPYLTMLNSLPKVALGPLFIILIGANDKSIIFMGVIISIIICIQTILNGFKNTDIKKIRMLKSFNANKKDILFNLVIPSNYKVILNTLKINISMSLIGIIMGEFLTSKKGIGYLILYGSQVFNLDIVYAGIIILIIISIILYLIIDYIEKKFA